MTNQQKLNLIRFIENHYVTAYTNEAGTVTMENRFFNCDDIEYVEVSSISEARFHLGY